MSHATPRSALTKRKADGDSFADGGKKYKLRRRAKNDIDIVGDDQQPDPTVEANQQHIRIIGDDQQPSETVETDHQPDNTADYTVDADQQAMPSSSVPDDHKMLKIKVIDAAYIIPDKIMEVDYDDTISTISIATMG
ncbi:hypothetical protein KI688_007976 [Linnemannia hyalina]|uniref:Uncharacterized protein n=1 Tax=Linnemannia hyalina TaxID=64524 RepID=A0A9P7XZY1_9FUNG|nr:hypothetical protein KI688_007976 [Linnemannia hyalina]